MAAHDPARARRAAAEYVSAGWRIVPVPAYAKNPNTPGWPQRVFTPEDIDGNVGVILGPVSGDLVDIDLDAYWALPLAEHFLPPTLTFGRASKPASHWLYICPGIRSRVLHLPPRAVAVNGSIAQVSELVEIRAKNSYNDECGHQSVFPGSTHAAREAIEWTEGCADSPAEISAEELTWACTRLATAAAICDGHDPGNQRNNRTMAYAGTLCAAGWPAEDIRHLFEAVFTVKGVEPDQWRKDADVVERTILAFERGEKLKTTSSLEAAGLIGEAHDRIFRRLARSPQQIANEARIARTSVGHEARQRLIAEARANDAREFTEAAEFAAELAKAHEAERITAATAGTPGESRIGRIIDLTQKPKPLDYLCHGLAIAPGKITAVTGFGGVGKGPFVNTFALCVAAGRPFLGHAVKRSKVTLLDFETGPLLEWRLDRIANALGVDLAELHKEEWLTCVHALPPIDDSYLSLMEGMIDENSLVCIDSYTSAVVADQRESTFSNVAFALGAISTRKNCTFVVVGHERKNQQGVKASSGLERVSGHASFTAAMQTSISLRHSTDADRSLVDVYCERAPTERFDSFQIRWEDVDDPSAPQPQTPGEKLQAAGWGLRCSLVGGSRAELQIGRESIEELGDAIERQEVLVLKLMQAQYANCQVSVRDLTRAGSSAQRSAREIAIRKLVERGALRANYHWRDATYSTMPISRRAVWLPYEGSPAGVVQA